MPAWTKSSYPALHDPHEDFSGLWAASKDAPEPASTDFLCPSSKLFRRFKTVVNKDWIDYNSHLTESRYLFVFGQGTDALLKHIKIDEEYVEREKSKKSYYTVETHIRHLDEAKLGSGVEVWTQLLKVDGKRIHLFHEMRESKDSSSTTDSSEAPKVVATAEMMLLHVNTDAGRACNNENEESVGILHRIWGEHEKLERPVGAGRSVGAPR